MACQLLIKVLATFSCKTPIYNMEWHCDIHSLGPTEEENRGPTGGLKKNGLTTPAREV